LDDIKLRIWPRADGLTEIEGEGQMARFRTEKEVDAFLAGFRACHNIVRQRVQVLDITDDRRIRSAPSADQA
jgi:hypothetical protein